MIKRIVIDSSYDRSGIRYANALVLTDAREIDKVVQSGIECPPYEAVETCESVGRKLWGSDFEIVANGISGSETFNY